MSGENKMADMPVDRSAVRLSSIPAWGTLPAPDKQYDHKHPCY